MIALTHRVRDIIDEAPDDPSELCPWMDSLPHDEFESVWCALITEHLVEMSIREAAKLLTYVRERYRLFSIMGKRRVPQTEFLKDLHVEQKLSINDISKRLGRGNGTIHRWLKKEGMTRSFDESMRARAVNLDSVELRRMYVDELMTCREIAAKLGCCSHTTIRNRIKALGISRTVVQSRTMRRNRSKVTA